MRIVAIIVIIVGMLLSMPVLAQNIRFVTGDTTFEMAGKKKAVEYDLNLEFMLYGRAANNIDAELSFVTLRAAPIKFIKSDDGTPSADGTSHAPAQ